MDSRDFISSKEPIAVEVELSSTDSGGLHNPVVPGQNFRPDMYIGPGKRQFWGQIDFAELVYPGDTANGFLLVRMGAILPGITAVRCFAVL